MTTVRTHRYTVETGKLATMLERRTNLINGIRSANPALIAATLIKLDDGSYRDIWRWSTAGDMQRAAAAAAQIPLVGATLTLTDDHIVIDGEILDER